MTDIDSIGLQLKRSRLGEVKNCTRVKQRFGCSAGTP